MDELVAGYLPLVYNVVGRAPAGHSDINAKGIRYGLVRSVVS